MSENISAPERSEQSEQEILEEIQQVFSDLNKNKDQQREIDDYLSEKHRIHRGTIYELLVNPEKFELYGEVEKGVFINAIYQVTKDESINPETFYNQKEIGKILKYKRKEDIASLTKPYTFQNHVIQTSESDYITALKVKEVGALWNSKLLDYNFDIQRKAKEKVNKKGETERTPKVFTKSVKEITSLMSRGRFRSNPLTFCIIMDEDGDISYNEGELTFVAGNMYIIDGFHRLSAILNYLEENPNAEDYIDVSIKFLSYDDARHFLGQMNKMSKHDKSYVNYLMNEKIEDKIVNDLDRKSSTLHDRITKDATVPKKKLYLTSYNVLTNGVRDIFNPQDNKDRIEIVDTLVYVFDYLIDSYPEDFSKDLNTLIKARDNSLRNYHNTFVIYLVIAKGLHDKYGKGSNIPSDEIIRLVDSFDYSKDGEYAKVLFNEGTGKVNANQVKRNIRKYAEDKISQLLN
jgi:hypothetical protein